MSPEDPKDSIWDLSQFAKGAKAYYSGSPWSSAAHPHWRVGWIRAQEDFHRQRALERKLARVKLT